MRLHWKKRAGGFSLVEIVLVMAIVALLALLSLLAINDNDSSGETNSVAGVISQELEATRQLAIRSGQPVALGIPTDNGGNNAACSLYRLKGWNTAYVVWSSSLVGEYPEVGFAACTWSGAPSVAGPLALPATAKYFNFGDTELQAWLPDDSKNDYVFCYLPDGSLITNGLPTVNGEYPIVVAKRGLFAGAAPGNVRIESGNVPFTVYVSSTGGTRMVNGCAGASLAAGTGSGEVSATADRTKNEESEPKVYISELNVRPNPSGVPGEGICVPGQVVTLEVYAHCREGLELFANWEQEPGTISDLDGSFTYPNQTGSALEFEADRMEYLSPDRIPTGVEAPRWGDPAFEPEPNTGIFRAQWTWTVPPTSQEGDLYFVTANVRDAEATAKIETPPRRIQMNPAPAGKLLVERFDPNTGLWQLWRMNPDGSGEQRVSPEGMNAMMPTVDRHGNWIAYIRETPIGTPGVPATRTGPNNRYVIVQALDGKGAEIQVDGPGPFTSASISPDGVWVSYRNNATDRLIVTRTNGTGRFEKDQVWGGSGYTVKKGRSGWSYDSDYIIYGHDDGAGNPILATANLRTPGPGTGPDHVLFSRFGSSGTGISRMFSPHSYKIGGQHHVVMSCSGNDSYLFNFPVVGNDYTINQNSWGTVWPPPPAQRPAKDWGGGLQVGSLNIDEDYPYVSPEGAGPLQLTYTTSPTSGGGTTDDANQEVVILDQYNATTGTFFGAPPKKLAMPNIRRAIFLPAE